jgi:hypothetical protein
MKMCDVFDVYERVLLIAETYNTDYDYVFLIAALTSKSFLAALNFSITDLN